MTLPPFIPQVSRPWNPAFGATWDAMSPNARRWSFLINTILCTVGVVFFCVLWGGK